MRPNQMCAGGFSGDEVTASSVPGTVSAITLGVAFTLLALGVEQFWVVFIIGFCVVLPTATGYAKRAEQRPDEETAADSDDPALAQLRERYARGELTDEEFERQVEQLLVAQAKGRDGAEPTSW